MSRMSALLAVIAAVAFFPLHADAATLSLVGASTKICQLTGETDWATNQPTAAQTLSHFGLDAVDLGFPVDSGTGPLFFLFGDAIPNGHPPGSIPSVPPDDALGWTTRTAPPDSSTCLDLQLATKAPQKFAHPTVFPPILQGSFNVPSGGIFFDNIFYAFFWTNHCVLPGVLTPDPGAPLISSAAQCDLRRNRGDQQRGAERARRRVARESGGSFARRLPPNRFCSRTRSDTCRAGSSM